MTTFRPSANKCRKDAVFVYVLSGLQNSYDGQAAMIRSVSERYGVTYRYRCSGCWFIISMAAVVLPLPMMLSMTRIILISALPGLAGLLVRTFQIPFCAFRALACLAISFVEAISFSLTCPTFLCASFFTVCAVIQNFFIFSPKATGNATGFSALKTDSERFQYDFYVVCYRVSVMHPRLNADKRLRNS